MLDLYPLGTGKGATTCYDDSYPNLCLMCSGPSLGPYLSRRLEHGIRHPSARRSLYNEVIRVRYGPPRVALKSSTRVLRHTEHSQRSIQTSLNSTQCPDWDPGCAFQHKTFQCDLSTDEATLERTDNK